LVSVERSGATWRLKLKDADNVNRALVVLDDKFKLVKVEQTTNSRESLKDPNCPV
jgi:hypothetical protein